MIYVGLIEGLIYIGLIVEYGKRLVCLNTAIRTALAMLDFFTISINVFTTMFSCVFTCVLSCAYNSFS